MRLNDDGRTVSAMDALAPGIGEIIGGSQREERLAVLDRSMVERGIDREHYAPTLPSPGWMGASASGAPSPTSPASAMCATRSPSRERQGMRGTDSHYFSRELINRRR
jgi:hypothetical protein